MKHMLKLFAKRLVSLIPLILVERYSLYKFGYNLLSYSQFGEDILLRNYFSKREVGFYIDVGAHHPTRFSNTYWFYRKGWRGINIDATPGSMTLFNTQRPRDINIEAAIALDKKEITFHIFSKPALNTFSKEAVEACEQAGHRELGQIKIHTKTLTEVLRAYKPEDQSVDFMTIDVEGLDLEVLKSNDWSLCTPKVILAEDNDFNLEQPQKSQICVFLKEKGYRLTSFNEHTLFFVHL